jgi:catechol 2,3-dioxygenase-like lactoylglutathione lyase family enzyme
MDPSAFFAPARFLQPIRAFATVALTLIALTSVVSAGTSTMRLLYRESWSWRTVYEWNALYALLLSPVILLFWGLHLLAGIAFVCWLFRARGNAYAISPGVFHKYAAPYLMFGWVAPVANLFVPKGIVDDILATSRPGGLRPGTDLFRGHRSGLVWAWWSAWLLWTVTETASVLLGNAGMTVLENIALVACVLLPIVAGLLAARVVLTITNLQETARAGLPTGGRPLKRPGPPVGSYFGLTTLIVHDYDEAIGFYLYVLGFELLEDTPLGDGRRWVTVRPRGARETALLLARADGPAQEARIGDQTGGRVGLFLHTDDFARDYERLLSAGVIFEEAPRSEPYGKVVVFLDLYGNRLNLFQPADVSPAYG